MTHFVDEVPSELVVGEIYTERQIATFIMDRRDFVILCEVGKNFNVDNRETKYKVLSAETPNIIAKSGMMVTRMNIGTKVYRIKMMME